MERSKRVRLIYTTDVYTRLQPGDEGTVLRVDDAGTVSIKWDDGTLLGLIPGVDRWEVIHSATPRKHFGSRRPRRIK